MRVLKRISLYAAAVFFIAIFCLVIFDPHINLENTFLLLLFNTLFIGLLPLFVSIIAARTYLSSNAKGALYLSFGMLVFGLGCIVAGVSGFTNESSNAFVTVHNICSLVSSIAILAASLSESGHTVMKDSLSKKAVLLSVCAGSCLFICAVIVLAAKGLTPPFFDGNGFTKIRYAVLFCAVALYFAASMNHAKQYQKNGQSYHYWYALSLLLISLGLLAVGISKIPGTPLSWAGRASQYLGAVFALLSMAEIYRKAVDKKALFTDIMADFFNDAAESYTSLINSAPDSVLTVDQDLHIFIVNPSATVLFKMKVNEVVGASFLEFLEQPYRDQVREDIKSYHETGVSRLIGRTEEMTARDRAGRIFPIEISFSSRRLKHNDAITMIIRDITERRKNESSLKQSELHALALVEELKKADESKNQFICILSHELRNPLATIAAGLYLLDMKEDMSDVKKTLNILHRQTDQLSKLVEDLLELTRFSQNKIKLKRKFINLREIVYNVACDYLPMFEQKGVRFETDIEEKPMFLEGDAVRLSQMIGNILSNAASFTSEGNEVLLSVGAEENCAVITVRDNGEGIEPEMLPILFTPFTQADQSLARINGGLGLGLSIAKDIAELHGGGITAHSGGAGLGAAFTIRLPFDCPGEAAGASPQACGDGLQPRRVVIIDDNGDFAAVHCELLKQMGHQAVYATSGPEGIALSEEFEPDIIFCDIGLHGMNGYELVRHIKNRPSLEKTVLFAVTGFAGEYDKKRAMQAGFDRHLSKPIDISTLRQALEDSIG